MEKKLSKILKQGRLIKPRDEFRKHSLQLIIASVKEENGAVKTLLRAIRENLKFGLVITAASFLLFLIIGNRLPISGEKILRDNAAAFSDETILKEIENLNFQIQLEEVSYFTESAKEIAAILWEIKDPDSEIDQLLNEIIF